jgi:hypothetical protein
LPLDAVPEDELLPQALTRAAVASSIGNGSSSRRCTAIAVARPRMVARLMSK